MEETAYAKLNLALHVRAREPDGYHRIETLFAFCADGDRLTAAPADALSLEVTGPFGAGLSAGEDNLVLRAARALQAGSGMAAGAAIRLDKRLPVEAGLGGGSADAAAALRLLSRLWGVADRGIAQEIAPRLGADVPACLASIAQWGRRRGDLVEPAEHWDGGGRPVLLINPGVGVSTAAIYGAWNGVDRGGLDRGDAFAAAIAGRNDLQPPAVAAAPVIAEVLEMLGRARGVRLARMSGSGATCFALFDDAAARDAAAEVIATERPGWWQLASILR